MQLYVGLGGASISFPNRAAAEIDIYGGIRPTFGMFAFDFGVFGYLYPGGQCFNTARIPGSGIPGSDVELLQWRRSACCRSTATLSRRTSASIEGYAKVNVTLNDMLAVGVNEYYSPNFLNLGAWGNYASITAQVHGAELDLRLKRPRHVHLR